MIALALACLARSPDAPPRPAPDAAFARAVEDFVIDSRPPGTGLTLALGPRRAAIVRTLGNNRHDARRLAAELLDAEPPAWRRRMLLWGSRAKDAEIAATCRRMWDASECGHCGGPYPGRCPLRRPDDTHQFCSTCYWNPRCAECLRAGRLGADD